MKFKIVQASSRVHLDFKQIQFLISPILVDRAIQYVIKISDEFQTGISIISESNPESYVQFEILIITPLQVHTVLFCSGLLGRYRDLSLYKHAKQIA